MKKFTISVLTYRAFPMVKGCIESILAHSQPGSFDLILTNNGNTNGCGQYFDDLQRMYPDFVRVVHHTENQGFIKPNNHALTMCETPYFVLLNDDAKVPQGWLDALEEPFKLYPKAALSGLSGGCQSLNEDFHGRQGGNFEYLEGSCLMCSTEIVKKHGLFSPYLEFAYGEDSDLSLRMRELGYTLHKVNLMLHHVRAQTSMHIQNIKQIQSRNHKVLCKRWSHYLRVRKFDYPTIVRRWAARGDVLLVSAILKKLKEQNPQTSIIVETAFPDYFKDNPYVSNAGSKSMRHFDMKYINLDMAYENRNGLSILDAYADVAEVPRGDYQTFISFTAEDADYANKFLKGKAFGRKATLVAIHAGPTTWQGKNWPVENWVELATILKEQYDAKILLVGHGDSTPIPCSRDARGATTESRTAALLAGCDLFIGLDSFPLHLAQAVKIPTIGLFGVTKPEMIMIQRENSVGVTGDKTLSDYGCRHIRPGQVSVPSNGEAMRSIKVADVLRAVDKFIPLKLSVTA